MTKTELKHLRTQQAQNELTLKVLKLLDDFKSKEEPTITLTIKEKVEVLLGIVTSKVRRYLK
jgi:hypothetical protein